MGFLTNALNPKTTLFVVSTYTGGGRADPLPAQFGYGLFMSAAHGVVQPGGLLLRRAGTARGLAPPCPPARPLHRLSHGQPGAGARVQQAGLMAPAGRPARHGGARRPEQFARIEQEAADLDGRPAPRRAASHACSSGSGAPGRQRATVRCGRKRSRGKDSRLAQRGRTASCSARSGAGSATPIQSTLPWRPRKRPPSRTSVKAGDVTPASACSTCATAGAAQAPRKHKVRWTCATGAGRTAASRGSVASSAAASVGGTSTATNRRTVAAPGSPRPAASGAVALPAQAAPPAPSQATSGGGQRGRMQQRRPRRRGIGFQPQQEALALHAARIAGQAAVGAKHAMAGHQHRADCARPRPRPRAHARSQPSSRAISP